MYHGSATAASKSLQGRLRRGRNSQEVSWLAPETGNFVPRPRYLVLFSIVVRSLIFSCSLLQINGVRSSLEGCRTSQSSLPSHSILNRPAHGLAGRKDSSFEIRGRKDSSLLAQREVRGNAGEHPHRRHGTRGRGYFR